MVKLFLKQHDLPTYSNSQGIYIVKPIQKHSCYLVPFLDLQCPQIMSTLKKHPEQL